MWRSENATSVIDPCDVVKDSSFTLNKSEAICSASFETEDKCGNGPSTSDTSSRSQRKTALRAKKKLAKGEDNYFDKAGIPSKHLGGTVLALGAQRESTGWVSQDLLSSDDEC